jgi:hypothetical protein
LHRRAASPQRGHAHVQFSFSQQLLVEIPLRLVMFKILRAGHAFAIESLNDAQHVVSHAAALRRRRCG